MKAALLTLASALAAYVAARWCGGYASGGGADVRPAGTLHDPALSYPARPAAIVSWHRCGDSGDDWLLIEVYRAAMDGTRCRNDYAVPLSPWRGLASCYRTVGQ